MGDFEIDPYFVGVYILYNLVAAAWMYLLRKPGKAIKGINKGEFPNKGSRATQKTNGSYYMFYERYTFMRALFEALPKMSFGDEISVTPKQLFWIRQDPKTQSYSRDVLTLKKQHAGMFMGHPIIVRRETEGES